MNEIEYRHKSVLTKEYGSAGKVTIKLWVSIRRKDVTLQVIIEGFKSYKDQTRTDPFSNKINAIGMILQATSSHHFQSLL